MKAARYGLCFYVITMIVAFIFPKKVFGNIYIVLGYLLVCMVFISFIYFKKQKGS